MQTQKPQSLLPYDENYVLINKWTLLVNSATITLMCEFISKMTGEPAEQIAATFGSKANEYFENFTDEEVTEQANNMIANFWKLNGSQLVVTDAVKPPDEIG